MKNRRQFFKKSALITAGIMTSQLNCVNANNNPSNSDNIYLIGPQDGFSPLIGTLLSTLTMMRTWVSQPSKWPI